MSCKNRKLWRQYVERHKRISHYGQSGDNHIKMQRFTVRYYNAHKDKECEIKECLCCQLLMHWRILDYLSLLNILEVRRMVLAND